MVFGTIYQYFNKHFSIPWLSNIVFLWIIYKNECILSFFEKKYKNPNYKMGDNVSSTPDLKWKEFLVQNNIFIIYKLLNLTLIPYYYYLITKNITKTIIFATILIICSSNNIIFNNFITSKFRYILLPFFMYTMNDINILNKSDMIIVYNIMNTAGIGLVIYTFNNYKDEGDILEMSIFAITCLIYSLYVNNRHFLMN